MTRRTLAFFVVFFLFLLGLASLATPLLAETRGRVWQAWTGLVARIGGEAFLTPDDSVFEQVKRLQAENIRLQAELRDYEALRTAIGSVSYDSLRAIPAAVTGEPLDIFHAHLILNKGADDGVTLHAPVVTRGSVLVGYVSELTNRTAVVQLLIHPTTSIPGEVQETEGARGLVRGTAYTSLTLETVPRDVSLSPGQTVITAAQEATPAGLLVGSVANVRHEENEAYQSARLDLPYVPHDVRAVNVLVAP